MEIKGQIKLRFKTVARKDLVCIRTFQLTQKAAKMEYKVIESVLQTINPQTGEAQFMCSTMLTNQICGPHWILGVLSTMGVLHCSLPKDSLLKIAKLQTMVAVYYPLRMCMKMIYALIVQSLPGNASANSQKTKNICATIVVKSRLPILERGSCVWGCG